MLQHVVLPRTLYPGSNPPRGLGRHQLPSARGAASSINPESKVQLGAFAFYPSSVHSYLRMRVRKLGEGIYAGILGVS
jgi:hypothetical protein